MEQVSENKILTQEQIETINKAITRLIDIWNDLVKVVKDITSRITKIWKELLLKIYRDNKKIKKINHIYIYTKNKRIKKKQISRLYKILKE